MNQPSTKNTTSMMLASKPQQSVSHWIDQFELALQGWNEDQSISEFLPDETHSERETILAEILRVYLEWNWERKRDGVLETLLAEFPWLMEMPNVLSQVAFEDFRLRSSSVNSKPAEFYRDRFSVDISQWQNWMAGAENQLGSRFTETESGRSSTISAFPELASHSSGSSKVNKSSARPISLAAEASRLPMAGETFGDFDLLLMIGEGAFSRVFVSRQRSLADRLVVVKVTRTPLGESQLLARLQHGNIMPLYSAQKVSGLYLLVMPFLGAVTLKQLIEHRFGKGANAATPQEEKSDIAHYLAEQRQMLFDRLGPFEQPGLIEENTGLQLRLDEFLGGVDWTTAILRIFSCLADGLSYSHRRGIQQRDIKPANILLGFDGQPILLDFNLSRITRRDSADIIRSVGGTLPYMAPEHRLAMQTGIDDLTPAVDVFSLGVVLHEALTGIRPKAKPFSTTGSPDIDNSIDVPTSSENKLSSALTCIVSKAIETTPGDRYPSSAALQTDLLRQLADQPLLHAKNLSLNERWQKFRRRNRRLFSTGAMISILVALSISVGAMGYVWLDGFNKMEARDRYSEFLHSVHKAEGELFLADGGSRVVGTSLVQQAISISSSSKKPEPAAWVGFLDDARQTDVVETREYLGRLLELSSANKPPIRNRASTSVSGLERATDAFFDRDFDESIKILESEIRLNPQRFLCWFLKGRCHFDKKEFREAERSFAMSLTIESDCVPALVGQGLCHFGMMQFDEAEVSFRQAIEIQSDSFAAHYNLALVLEKQARYSEALAELKSCKELKMGSTRVAMTRSRIARLMGNTEMADRFLNEGKSIDPDEPEGWVVRGLARLAESPEGALADFAEAQKFPDTMFVAGQNRAHVLSEYLQRPAEAVEVLSSLIVADADFLPALAGRAVLLARMNQREKALADIETMKRKSLTPQLHYQIACVYALLSVSDAEFEGESLKHLSIAAQPVYGGQIIASDKDLDSLRKNEKFEAILNGINAANSVQTNH